ncbi:hypothetical protein [Streptomyces niveus]|uniref:hypothetical protein n=1 Tax=Streptomyces niveus TaxID=193462 RepID=UPI0036B01E67
MRARDEPSPLYEPEDPRAFEDLGAFTRNVPRWTIAGWTSRKNWQRRCAPGH